MNNDKKDLEENKEENSENNNIENELNVEKEKMVEEISKTIDAHKNKNFFKKVWYAITKIERYLEMAAEGVFRAIIYLLLLNLIGISIISGIVVVELKENVHEFTGFLSDKMPDIVYENGKLAVDSTEKIEFEEDGGRFKVIIDTNEVDEEQEAIYLSEISDTSIGAVIYDEYAIVNVSGVEDQNIVINYANLLTGEDKLEKEDMISYLTGSQMTSNYLGAFAMFAVILLSSTLVVCLSTILIVSLSGVIASRFIGMKIKYRALFNMSIYSVTLSLIMQYMYSILNMYIDFKIEYFDVMYMTVSTIYLVGAVFIIKAELLKKTQELQNVLEFKAQVEQNKPEAKPELEPETKPEENKEE